MIYHMEKEQERITEMELQESMGEMFWNNVKTIMKKVISPPMSLKTLAEKTGINYNTLRTYRARKKPMRVDQAYLIADALDVSFDLLTHELTSFTLSRFTISGKDKRIVLTEEESALIVELRKGTLKEYQAKLSFLTATMAAANTLAQKLFFADESDFRRFPDHEGFEDISRRYKTSKKELCNMLEELLEKRKKGGKGR